MTTDPTPNLMDLPDEEIIKIYIEQFHMSESDARFTLAMERGYIGPDGDIITVDENGNEQ